MIVVIHHDEPASWGGLRLAVASVLRHCPGQEITASCPGAPSELVSWLAERCTEVHAEPRRGKGWNVKPEILLRLLELGHEQVLWLDADIVVTGDFRKVLPADPNVFVATEDYRYAQRHGSRIRTAAWGLPIGRELPVTVNSCLVRTSQTHRPLLKAWQELLDRPEYREAQERCLGLLHFIGDQDALTALLGSAPWAELPLHLLRRGRDIAQCFGASGFTATERVTSLRYGLPPLVHAQGVKPWQVGATWRAGGSRVHRLRTSYQDSHARLSPYTIAARQIALAASVSLEGSLPRTAAERALLRLDRWPQIPELPLAVFEAIVRRLRSRLGIGRWAVVGPGR